MARSKLFEYTVIYHPKTKKDAEQNEVPQKSVLIVKPDWVLAKDDKEVGILAARQLPEEYLDKLDDIEIIIRPFN